METKNMYNVKIEEMIDNLTTEELIQVKEMIDQEIDRRDAQSEFAAERED